MNENPSTDELITEEKETPTLINDPFYKKYKLHLSIAAAVLVVGVSALAHYKNEKVKEELIRSISEYQQGLVLIGAEMKYNSIECSGIFTTDCEVEKIAFSMMGQEQLSISSLRIGDVEAMGKFKGFGKGEEVDSSIDIEAKGVALPQPIIAQLIAQNVNNAFQQNTLSKLSSIDMELKADVVGNSMHLKELDVEKFKIDNAIMPLEFSMKAREISSEAPDSMILERFALHAENKAISDVTYESVKSFVDTLNTEEKGLFLKEFGLTPAQINDRAKASKAINDAIAKRFESDLPSTSGIVEKELIRAMIEMLKGEADTISLEGKNKNDLTMVQIQEVLQKSSTMSEAEAKKYMDDKFQLEVTTD